MQRSRILILLFCVFFLPPAVSRIYADEEILSFHSDIVVHPDASMTVTEKIVVTAEGREINHGIYRDFPTEYKDRYGNRYTVVFDVESVLKDGEPENYFQEAKANGQRVYIGQKDVTLRSGRYAYTITYHTTRQLGFFKDHDELYWNVTGNGWVFPMREVSAEVTLPSGAYGQIMEVDAYTGPEGSKGKDFTSTTDLGKVIFKTTRQLAAKEGLTIVVSWPKGFVVEPTQAEKLGYVLKDNVGLIVGFAGLIALLFYYLSVWSKVGKDPARGTIIPLYDPPDKFSPASVRYLMRMGFDHKVFTAAVIHMAVAGYLKIIEKDNAYTLVKTGKDDSVLTPEEKEAAAQLFKGADSIVLKNTSHTRVSSAITSLSKSLNKSLEKIYYLTNRSYFVPGVFLSIALMIVTGLLSAKGEKLAIAAFMGVWLSIWTVGVSALVHQLFTAWRSVLIGTRREPFVVGGTVFLSFFAMPFIAGEIFGLGMFAYAVSVPVMLLFTMVAFINILFFNLLKAPTYQGRKLMDRIEGFKMFLSVAEKDRMNVLNPPEQTPELFEKYLPYALALDVEQQWSEKFSKMLAKAAQEGQEYSPSWYSGRSFSSHGMGGFTSNLSNSFSSAISSASVAPGSSSGGGGGGSSGGGGGGGGGGGW